VRVQAAADARGAAHAQEVWLKANMAPHFSRKLLGVVKRIERNMGPHDGDASHQFPRLAGSFLSEVRPLTFKMPLPNASLINSG
jgi:hypothetical protein